MESGTLTIYSASAGSGKTFRLAGFYLEKIFASRYAYRKILAVTFTNKATAEMKHRILDELHKLASGNESKYLPDLVSATGRQEEFLRKEAKEILQSILHDYSRFYVSTIDSFFQKILRAFARDIGLHSGFDTEIDQSSILTAAVDKVIASASSDATVRKWLSGFVRANIEDEKPWDLRRGILNLAGELFREKFKLLSQEEKNKLQDKEFLISYINEIRAVSAGFRKKMQELGENCLSVYNNFMLNDEMFYFRGNGVPGFIKALAAGNLKAPNSYVRAILGETPKWCTGKMAGQLEKAIDEGFGDLVRKAVLYYDENISGFNSAGIILSNIYSLGILSDVLNQIHLIARDENIFLLSDTGELIYLITGNDQTPFIYEKIGNLFDCFMIDEFQDTSFIQWKNFKPLIDNSMSQGGDNLVVGDVKQSIYRWRNSDWRTLNHLRKEADGTRKVAKTLHANWRSRGDIIRFNNTLFSVIPLQLDLEVAGEHPTVSFRELFSEAVQTDTGNNEKGYVRIEFIADSEEKSWRQNVLQKLPEIIEKVQDRGYRASDIGILVRNNKEGADVLKHLISYASECPAEKKARYNYNVISNDSLLLSNSPAINFLLALLQVVDDPEDMIGKALMLRNYLISTGMNDADKIPLPGNDLSEFSKQFFPEGYLEFIDTIRYLSLWDITEKSIKFFGLGEFKHNVPYLCSFQDIIIRYSSNKNPSVASFLDWWEQEGINKSVSLPEQQDAIQVLTIHKSKGLQFGVVILPFLSWNLDHKHYHSNIIWTKPGREPFSKIGIVPVRYRKELSDSIFAEDYFKEKHSAYLDNLNLLYVAMTRAENAIFGFAPENPDKDSRIASVIKNAITFNNELPGGEISFLKDRFDPSSGIFEFGEIPGSKDSAGPLSRLEIENYPVNDRVDSLKLRLHWENYFIAEETDAVARINYGKMMHEVFATIITADDIPSAVRKKVIEGEIPEEEEKAMCERILGLVSGPVIRDWFAEGNEVLSETSILLPGAESKRPDRVVLRDGKATIVDFKFGEEYSHHIAQVRQYRSLLTGMGYRDVEAFLWYVDSDRIVTV